MTLAVVIVVLWEGLVAALSPSFPLPDPALALAVVAGLRRRDGGEFAVPLVLGALAGLFTAAPWAVCPLECLVAASTAAWLARSIGPSGLTGLVLVVLCAMAAAALAQMAALAVTPAGCDAAGILVSAGLSAPLAPALRAVLPGRRRYGP